MNARPLLERVASALGAAGLEAILNGNAGAALHGAPVTTVDFDFAFRKTPRNLEKLKALARHLGAAILRPYYPSPASTASWTTTPDSSWTSCRPSTVSVPSSPCAHGPSP